MATKKTVIRKKKSTKKITSKPKTQTITKKTRI